MMIELIPNLKAETMNIALRNLFCRINYVRGIVLDRGSENSMFRELVGMLRAPAYFCDAGSPWQKGLVEQSIGQIRYYFKRNTKYSSLKKKDVYKVAAFYNQLYRDSLNGENASSVYARSRA